jgi:hypothetical protein
MLSAEYLAIANITKNSSLTCVQKSARDVVVNKASEKYYYVA